MSRENALLREAEKYRPRDLAMPPFTRTRYGFGKDDPTKRATASVSRFPALFESELPEKRGFVHLSAMFEDSSVPDGVGECRGEGDFFVRRGMVKDSAAVGATHGASRRDFVPFDSLTVDFECEVGEGGSEVGEVVFESLRPFEAVAMVGEFGGEYFVGEVEVSFVPNSFVETSGRGRGFLFSSLRVLFATPERGRRRRGSTRRPRRLSGLR